MFCLRAGLANTRDEDKYIVQNPPEVMFTDERLDEVATYTYMARGIARLKKKRDAEGFKGTLREYMKAVLKRKQDI